MRPGCFVLARFGRRYVDLLLQSEQRLHVGEQGIGACETVALAVLHFLQAGRPLRIAEPIATPDLQPEGLLPHESDLLSASPVSDALLPFGAGKNAYGFFWSTGSVAKDWVAALLQQKVVVGLVAG